MPAYIATRTTMMVELRLYSSHRNGLTPRARQRS